MSEEKKIVLVSDNHTLLKPIEYLRHTYSSYDYFFHCGDSEFPKKALKDFKELEQDKSNPNFSKDDPFYNVNQNNIQDCIKKYNKKVAELQKAIDETYTLFIDTLRKAVEEYEDSKTL